MRKKLLSFALALAMCLELVACGHSHVWQDATCTTPKTCAECGETEGEALTHTLGEANYQSPAVCEVCGEPVGEPLAAAFVSSDLDKSAFHLAELGVTYDYHTLAYDDHSVEQTNHVTFEDYRVITSDDTHAARDGYEWQIVRIHFLSDDASVGPLGWTAIVAYYDYYSGIKLATEDEACTVNYNGTDYECRGMFTAVDEWNSDRTVNDCQTEFAAQVPIGYDGVVVVALERFPGDSLEEEYPSIADLSETSLHYVRLGA